MLIHPCLETGTADLIYWNLYLQQIAYKSNIHWHKHADNNSKHTNCFSSRETLKFTSNIHCIFNVQDKFARNISNCAIITNDNITKIRLARICDFYLICTDTAVSCNWNIRHYLLEQLSSTVCLQQQRLLTLTRRQK